MTRHLLITLIISASCLMAWAQHDIGLKANFGLSYIRTKQTFWAASSNTTHTIYFRASGQGGLFYNAHLSPRSVIGTELLLIQIEGKEEFSTPYTQQEIPPHVERFWRHITYLGIPLYYGYKMKRFTVYMGAQVAFVIDKSLDVKREYIPSGPDLPVAHYPIVRNYDFGLRTGIAYKLSHKFTFETTYYYGLLNVFEAENRNNIPYWNIQQLVLGVRYNFVPKKEE
jgi:opacity protein-like surface antigen